MIDVKNSVEYLGVTAKLDSGQEVHYRPVEIATIWGKWDKQTNYSLKIILITLALSFCCCGLLIWRRMSRSGYRPLDDLA